MNYPQRHVALSCTRHYPVEIEGSLQCEMLSTQPKPQCPQLPSLTLINPEFVKVVLKMQCQKWLNGLEVRRGIDRAGVVVLVQS